MVLDALFFAIGLAGAFFLTICAEDFTTDVTREVGEISCGEFIAGSLSA